MRSIAVVVIACLVVASGASRAETPDPDREKGRYTFKEVADGLLRLDARTGQVSLCNKRTTGWACQALPDDRTALEDEIARVEKENQALRKDLAARGLSLPDGVRREPRVGSRGDQDSTGPSDADLDRVMTFMEKAWRRLLDMVQRMQKEESRKM
jgi:hypothetical protein